jgi:hypothetical protein
MWSNDVQQHREIRWCLGVSTKKTKRIVRWTFARGLFAPLTPAIWDGDLIRRLTQLQGFAGKGELQTGYEHMEMHSTRPALLRNESLLGILSKERSKLRSGE